MKTNEIISSEEKLTIFQSITRTQYSKIAAEDTLDKTMKDLIGEELFGHRDRLNSRELQILCEVLELLIKKITSQGE